MRYRTIDEAQTARTEAEAALKELEEATRRGEAMSAHHQRFIKLVMKFIAGDHEEPPSPGER